MAVRKIKPMIFFDFGPWRASKIVPTRLRIVTVDFSFKSTARIKKQLFQTNWKHQHHWNTLGKARKACTWKSSKSTRPTTLRSAEIQLSPNVTRTNIRSTKTLICIRPKHQKYEYLQGQWMKIRIVTLRDFGSWRASEIVPPRLRIVAVDFSF